MIETVDWPTIALRLFLTVVAGLMNGFNRGEHGEPAGLRTTLLVCLAASIAMLQANLLLGVRGKSSDSYVVLDLMRLPLGILTGVGFIGAGAIFRQNNLVRGVTTATTLWFVSVIGLCFGGGQIGLGIAGTIIGVAALWGLKALEERLTGFGDAAYLSPRSRATQGQSRGSSGSRKPARTMILAGCNRGPGATPAGHFFATYAP